MTVKKKTTTQKEPKITSDSTKMDLVDAMIANEILKNTETVPVEKPKKTIKKSKTKKSKNYFSRALDFLGF